jgi:hypothetical protein
MCSPAIVFIILKISHVFPRYRSIAGKNIKNRPLPVLSADPDPQQWFSLQASVHLLHCPCFRLVDGKFLTVLRADEENGDDDEEEGNETIISNARQCWESSSLYFWALFCKQYFNPLNNFMRKGKYPDPYL